MKVDGDLEGERYDDPNWHSVVECVECGRTQAVSRQPDGPFLTLDELTSIGWSLPEPTQPYHRRGWRCPFCGPNVSPRQARRNVWRRRWRRLRQIFHHLFVHV